MVASDMFKRKWHTSERRTATKRGGRPIGDEDPLQKQVCKGMLAHLYEERDNASIEEKGSVIVF